MKITVDIDDKVLQAAVTAQVGALLSEWTGKALEEKATEIIGTKLSRFSVEEFVGRKTNEEVRRVVERTLNATFGGHSESHRANLTALIKQEVAARVDAAFKAEFSRER